jgi:hypothetical protein
MKDETIVGWPTPQDDARLVMSSGLGAYYLQILGLSQEQFWRFVKRAAKRPSKPGAHK